MSENKNDTRPTEHVLRPGPRTERPTPVVAAKPELPARPEATVARRGTIVSRTAPALADFLGKRIPSAFARRGAWSEEELGRFAELVKILAVAEVAVLLAHKALRLCERRLAKLAGLTTPKATAADLAAAARAAGEGIQSKAADLNERRSAAYQNAITAFTVEEGDLVVSWPESDQDRLWAALCSSTDVVEVVELLTAKAFVAEETTYRGIAGLSRPEDAVEGFLREKVIPDTERQNLVFCREIHDAQTGGKKDGHRHDRRPQQPKGLATIAEGVRNQGTPAAEEPEAEPEADEEPLPIPPAAEKAPNQAAAPTLQ